MPEALLNTKLHIPRLRRDLVHRSRLIERLDAGLCRKLTLVSAPAGFGKSTLVSEWVHFGKRPTAWLSLDDNDNDLSRFLTYLITAIQRIHADIGIDVQAALAESQSPQFETLLTKLVSEIEVFQDEFTLVLDDYHLIHAKNIHDSLNFLIEYLPLGMHLVILGRSDPPIPISRLRVQGEVTEIRTPELRFTADEISVLLNDLLGFDLTPEDIASLNARTEGWIASLQLAALSLQGRHDKHEFVAAFSGSHRHIIDYLLDEVMANQSREIQAFLRQTSILDRFCAPLCDSALEIITSRRIIAKLEAANLFLIPLDDERHWYRYHHLFADFLVHRLHEAEPEHIPVLHRRASQWYEDESLVDEAIQHAIAAEDMERATRLVDQIAPDLVVRRESSKLLKLIDKLPPEGCLEYPMLCIWHAWALLFLGQLDVVEPILQHVEANQNKAPGVPIPGYVTTVRAYLANQWGHLQEAITLSERALELMSDAPPDRITLIFRGAAVIWLGVNHRLLGDLERASQLFDEAVSLNNEAGNFYGAMAAYEQSAELAVMRGQLHQSMEFNKQGIKLAKRWVEEDKFGRGTSIAEAGPHFGLGVVLYQLNDLDGATTHIQRAADLFDLGEIWGKIHSKRMQAYLKLAAGDYQDALELLSNACNIRDQIIVRQSNTADLPSLEQLRILLSRIQPEMAYLLTDAARRIEEQGLQPDDYVDFSSPEGYRQELDYTDLARVLIEQGRADEALPLLDRLLSAAKSMGRQGDEIHFLVLKALAFQNIGDQNSAMNVISLALHQARPEGYVRIFIDEGAPMAALLTQAILQDIESEYSVELLAAFPEEMRDSVEAELELATIAQPLEEPLSERELEVLRLMATGLKYQEIAGKLVVSVNTIRHHTRNIYGKLDVNSRAQAVARAQVLGLL